MRLYLLESDGFYKIGVANVVQRRIDDLQTGNPHRINLVAECRPVGKNAAYKAEQYIHTLLEKLNISGEWFRLSDADMSLLKETYVFLDNNDFSMLEVMQQKWSEAIDRIYFAAVK